MRLQFSNDTVENESLVLFAKGIHDIVDSNLGEDNDSEAIVEISYDMCIKSFEDHACEIVESTYPSFLENMKGSKNIKDQAILALTLNLVEKVDDYVKALIPGEGKEYFSCDTICKVNQDVEIDSRWIATKILNDIKRYGMPNHKLNLKIKASIFLL